MARIPSPGYYEELDYAWTMTIDLDRCSGCGACVTACKAENNLPIVGERAFAQGREVQWMRIERYWEGEYPDVQVCASSRCCASTAKPRRARPYAR